MILALSKIFYSLFINVYHLIIATISPFNEKAYKFTTGRLNQNIHHFEEKTIWFHCASLGEFEQAKPIINWCYKNLKFPIVITFFSPSGYTYKNNFPLARAVYYLPKDTPNQAKDFIKKINPAFAFFIKYEFWYYHLNELEKQKIPHYLIAGIFRREQLFFKSYGKLHQKMLKGFTHLFVQDENSKALLNENNYHNCSVAHDTRFDTVKQISELNFNNDIIEEFIDNQKCLVIGSSWPKDEQLVNTCMTSLNDYKIIIAPHDVNPTRLKQLNKLFKSHTFLSNPIDVKNKKVLIIDSIGQLSLLYRYASICYIGGGFGVSVHNVLEAAVYGKPLLYGPNHKKSKEALDLIKLGAAFEINNSNDLETNLNKIYKPDNYSKLCKISKNYVLEKTGGTNLVIKKIESSF